MRSDRVAVAIIGGGFSGTITAAQLARRGIASALIDGSGRIGRGVAYSTREPAHLLNVRAEGMSAWSGDVGDFAQRFEAEGGDPRGFAERRFFARYLQDILDEAVGSGKVELVEAFATGARRRDRGWIIEFEDGGSIEADALVLAIGNQDPALLGALAAAGDRYIANPWGAEAAAAVEDLTASGGSALLVGTGLTMVDLALSLDSAGYRGRAIALSRRGQVPRSHAESEPAPVDYEEVPSGSLRDLWRWLRRRSAEVGWRAAVDSLRPHSHALWQSLDGGQQRRFLRHARPYWDVHRHRIAPEVAQTIARMIAEGRLEVIAGRIVASERDGDALDVTIRKRGASTPQALRVDYAFNCTGPLQAIGRTRDPLLRSLLDAGQVRPDHLGIGLEVDEHSRAEPGERLWALGPLTKGRYWEIIAVPDIREQAAAVAEDISRELKS
jgi:uncharacterized NAD(P)/FAD-binding protein YdhS